MDTGNKDGLLTEATDCIASGREPVAEVESDLEKLRAYTRFKLELAGQLRILRKSLNTLGRIRGERQCDELMVKLAEDRFTLAVLGQFKRGKSSLINAIIGRELLPTGVLPLTSAITVLRYGPKEQLVVSSEGSLFSSEFPVSSLSDFVTERLNPSNQKKIKTVSVELPVPFLRHGIEFVDTPGIGSAITANTVTTYGFLPECDAVIFVTSADTPMTSLELMFLKEIREYVNKIFFVVNKTDLVTDNERDEVIEYVAKTINEQVGRKGVKIFPVSARSGLAARVSGDTVLYEQSGIKALEEALAFFLSEDKAATFLEALTFKALRILHEETEQSAFEKATLQTLANAMQEEKPVKVQRDPYAAAAAAMESQMKLEMLYSAILNGWIGEVLDTGCRLHIPTETGNAAVDVEITSPAKDSDIITEMQTRGCPVCLHLTKCVSDFFAHWQYLIATEARAQTEFAAELGFCSLHMWQLLAMSSPRGASIGHAQLAEKIACLLRMNKTESEAGNKVRSLVRNSQNCRVCKLLCLKEKNYIRRLATLISDASRRNHYLRSQGVCLRHLGMLMDSVSEPVSQELLLSHAAKRFEEDAKDMLSYVLKQEAARRYLQNIDEEDAYRRAVIRIAGARNLCIPW